MAAAGLTLGGFYKHFGSKDKLVALACAGALGSAIELVTVAAGKETSKRGSLGYRTTTHRDHPEGGCPLAAIGSELGRADEKTRAAATEGFLKLVDKIAAAIW